MKSLNQNIHKKKTKTKTKTKGGNDTDNEMELVDSEDYFINQASRCTRSFSVILRRMDTIISNIHQNFDEMAFNENGHNDRDEDEDEDIVDEKHYQDIPSKIRKIDYNFNLIGDRLVLLIDYEVIDEDQSILTHTLCANIHELRSIINNLLIRMHERANTILINLRNLLHFPDMFDIPLLTAKINTFTLMRNRALELITRVSTVISQYENDANLFSTTLDENLHDEDDDDDMSL